MEPRDEGAISDCLTQNSTLDCTLANRSRLAKPKIIAGSVFLARGNLLKAIVTPGPILDPAGLKNRTLLPGTGVPGDEKSVW
jgi:hypothetical protein